MRLAMAATTGPLAGCWMSTARRAEANTSPVALMLHHGCRLVAPWRPRPIVVGRRRRSGKGSGRPGGFQRNMPSAAAAAAPLALGCCYTTDKQSPPPSTIRSSKSRCRTDEMIATLRSLRLFKSSFIIPRFSVCKFCFIDPFI